MAIKTELTDLMGRMGSLGGSSTWPELSLVESIQAVLRRVQQDLDASQDIPSDCVVQARQLTGEALQELERFLHLEVNDVAASLQVVTQSIQTIKELIDQVGPGPSPLQTGPTGAPAKPLPIPSFQEKVVPEGDVSMVLDFVTEAREHLDIVEAGLLDLEKQSGDKEVINRIFRGFHTIKGMAGFLSLPDIGALAHSAENLLDMARKDKLVLQGPTLEAVFESMDLMKKMIGKLLDCVTAGQPVPIAGGLPDLLTRLKALVEGQAVAPARAPDLTVDKDHALDQILEPQAGDAPAKLDVAKTKGPVLADDKIKVSTARLDTLIDLVGELVIANLMVAEEVRDKVSTEPALGGKVSHLSKIVRELQELSMSMRMVPIQGVFHRMARLVRDLGHKSGKDIRLTTEGEETELDRTVVDKISDPLVHMIRNSVDHGIERAEDRQKGGKDPGGHIQLRAFHRAGNVIIEVEDDGKGLDKERIVKKAIEQGIVQGGQDLSDEDAYRLIFHAGLSTAEKVTDVSGRGVGMDVVRKNIEALQGRVEIHSTPGRGTRFTIRLPLTLAVIDGQIVKVGPERYIIPITSIVNSFRPQSTQISSVQNAAEVVSIRGELLPLVRLHRLFNVRPRSDDPAQGLLMIVEADARRCCVLVDDLLGQQQVVLKSLGDGLGQVKGVSGGAIMGDGRVSMILDVPGLIELSRS